MHTGGQGGKSVGSVVPPWDFYRSLKLEDFPGGSEDKTSACNVGDLGSTPGPGRSPGKGNGTLLQYSCLENSMGGGAWLAIIHGVAKSQAQLSNFTSLYFGTLRGRKIHGTYQIIK